MRRCTYPAQPIDRQTLGDLRLASNFADKRAKLKVADRLDQDNRIDLWARPASRNAQDFAKTSASGRLEIFAPDLVALPLPLDVIGDLTVNTDFQLENGKLSTQTVLDSSSLACPRRRAHGNTLRRSGRQGSDDQTGCAIFETLVSPARWRGQESSLPELRR